MGKPRNKGNRFNKKKEVLDSDEEAANERDPDPQSRSYIYDEIDEFHADREKVLLDAGIQYDESEQSDEEEVLALSLSDDDDGDDDDDDDQNLKDDMTSDLEDEGNLPDVKAWGKKKYIYYNTDYVDKAYENYGASDEEMAEAEEHEAKAIQQRLAKHLDELDFGLDLIKTDVKVPEKKEDFTIQKDFSLLSKQERLEILKRESPEFLGLVKDLKDKLLEIRDQTEPLFSLVKEGKIPPGPGAGYINIRHHLLLNYCVNLCFYLALKAKRTPTTHHPIIQRLVDYIKLIKELEPLDKKFANETTEILNCLKNGKDVSDVLNSFVHDVPKRKKKEKHFITPAQEIVPGIDGPKRKRDNLENPLKRKRIQNETLDKEEALRLYNLMKAGHKGSKSNVTTDYVKNKMEDISATDAQDETDDEVIINKQSDKCQVIANGDEIKETAGKRAINYQISKNKGLTPYRKKANRNVRVKNKLKYRKILIRRKGQVKEPRKETSKYGGEISGIKASSSRSVKFK